MFDGGCRGISFGVESGSQLILDNAKKGITVDQAAEAIKKAKKIGLKVNCSFMFGLPGESWNTIKETIDFVKKTCRMEPSSMLQSHILELNSITSH